MADVIPIASPITPPVSVTAVSPATSAPAPMNNATTPPTTSANAAITYTALATVSTSNIRGVGVNESA